MVSVGRKTAISTVRILIACAALFAVSVARGATRIELNGEWQFRTDPSGQGEQLGWSKQAPPNTETVRVPHTWNIGRYDDYEGTAWYFKTFDLSEDFRAKHVELHFGATFYKARVWLNGTELGEHHWMGGAILGCYQD